METAPIFEQLGDVVKAKVAGEATAKATAALTGLVQSDQYVGEIYSLGYETALVQIHDHHRKRVGGIPSLSFLVAARFDGSNQLDPALEDTAVVLLRVLDAAPLPNDSESLRVRVETAQRVSGELSSHWDEPGSMDSYTSHLLSFAGVRCRVLGTFYVSTDGSSSNGSGPSLRFGSDISNYYPNRGLKVYKPNGDALRQIVNFRSFLDGSTGVGTGVHVGHVRYASTNRPFQGIDGVEVDIAPVDLLAQKTALFGMTRTGKSNTTKMILQSVFELRSKTSGAPQRVGQIVFDPNGEYANENIQDQSDDGQASSIRRRLKQINGAQDGDVVSYGSRKHPGDLDRKLMLVNFYDESMIQEGKSIIDAALAADSSIYIRNFRQVVFEQPDKGDRSASTRYRRRLLVYRTLLTKAGFVVPEAADRSTVDLFGKELRAALRASGESSKPQHLSGAAILERSMPAWGELQTAFEALADFIHGNNQNYKDFESAYVNDPKRSGELWADDDLKKLLEMFRFANGSSLIGRVRNQHTPSATSDYGVDIVKDLSEGRLVIVDQSAGDPEVNRLSADRIMRALFVHNQELFRDAQKPPDILVYVEEAHNLLPNGSEDDLTNIWVRSAKEGAKYRIGMVYATQEVSSIQKNILRNTSNWFISHLNNTDETKELRKYYDFADFEASILRVQDVGFLRMKTLSNPFVVPVQVSRFGSR